MRSDTRGDARVDHGGRAEGPRRVGRTATPRRGAGDGAGRADRTAGARFGRRAAGERYARERRARRRRQAILRGSACAVALLLVLAAGVASAWGRSYAAGVGARLGAGVDDETRAALAAQQQEAQRRATSALTEGAATLPDDWKDTTPFYLLLMGTDKDESRASGEESALYGEDDANYRTDVLILARVDPGAKRVTLVSIHRDTIVEINGERQKINAAYALGGVPKALEVCSAFAGVPISHYAQVDIDGLAAVVDAMGGVTVDVPYTIDDPYMGHLDAGTQKLDGDQALILCRSRHAFDFMGDGDRYRAAHQRLFLAAMMQQLFASTPQTMLAVIDAAADHVTTDLTVDQIASLALTMRGMDVARDVSSTMNPTTSTVIGGVWYEVSDDDAWARLMATVDAGGRPDPDEGYLDPDDDLNSGATNRTTVTVADADIV